ncbi:MAG: methionyl-tRNA formyltransferase, partial [Porticoccus sp.]
GCTEADPGTIIDATNSGIRVNTGEGSLLITELQLPGKKRLPVAELLKSRAELFTPGTVLGQ